MPDAGTYPLLCHPWSRRDPAEEVFAEVRRVSPGALSVTFHVIGELSRLRLPSPRPPAIVEGLWQHTCFEAFVAVRDRAAYSEFNLAPSGEWAVFVFRSYRAGALRDDPSLAPGIVVRRSDGELELEARLALDRLPGAPRYTPLQIGLSAVLEVVDGARSYWALCHPSGRPDFHHPAAFALRLEAPGDADAAAGPLNSRLLPGSRAFP